MIVSNDGYVNVVGDFFDVSADLSIAVRGYYESLLEDGFTEDDAKELVALCGKIAFDQKDPSMGERMREILENTYDKG